MLRMPSSQIFADAQLVPFFEGICAAGLKHKQETMMEILFGGSVGARRRGGRAVASMRPRPRRGSPGTGGGVGLHSQAEGLRVYEGKDDMYCS